MYFTLLAFFVQGVLAAPLAEFIELQFLRLLLLIHSRGVVPPLALGAGEADDIRHKWLPPRSLIIQESR